MECNLLLLHMHKETKLSVSIATAACAIHEWQRALFFILNSPDLNNIHGGIAAGTGTFVTNKEMNEQEETKKNATSATYVKHRLRRSNTKYHASVDFLHKKADSKKRRKVSRCAPVVKRRRRLTGNYAPEVHQAQLQAKLQQQHHDAAQLASFVRVERNKVEKKVHRPLHNRVLLAFAKRRKLSLVCYPVDIHSDNFSRMYNRLFGCCAFSESLFYLTRPMNHTWAHDHVTGTLDPQSREGALCFLSTHHCIRIRMNRDIMITDFAYMYHFVPNHGRGFYGGRGGGVDEGVEVLAVADW